MSTYTHRVTAAVPELMIPDANQLAGCIGERMDDTRTYGEPRYEDAEGNRYAVMSTLATNSLLFKAGSAAVVRPEYDTEEALDLAAAQRALDATVIAERDAEGEWIDPLANPDRLTAIVHPSAAEAIALMGLTRIEEETV